MPVIVGVGQVVAHPERERNVRLRPSPRELMVTAAERAIDDAGLTSREFDAVVAVSGIGWPSDDAARQVADAMGITTTTTRRLATGGDTPQRLIHEAALQIQRGDLHSLLLVGGEAIYTASNARKQGLTLPWQVPSGAPGASQDERMPFNQVEGATGMVLPVEVYPLFENARRRRVGWTLADHRERLGVLWSNFARVAASNPYAWITTAPSAAEIATPSPTNRMVGFPYTKLLVANLPVDMGAALVLMSLAEARRRGVSTDRMVFPQCGADGYDHWFVSERVDLDHSIAMERIWRALRGFGETSDGLGHLDLYSCFPSVVQTAADVIDIDAFDPTRVPTVTGGLTFAGGPGNNYVTHSIATMVDRLRAEPGARGLVTGVGWYATKHAWGTYSSSPPASGFRHHNVQAEVDATPRCATRQGDGSVEVESFVVMHGHDGARERLVVVARFADGARVINLSRNDALMARFETENVLGARGVIRDSIFKLLDGATLSR
jgi:acetyl-CoA C-acetyltransferase